MADGFHPEYAKWEDEHRSQTFYFDREKKIRQEIRERVDLDQAERETMYMDQYDALVKDFDKAFNGSGGIGARFQNARESSENALYGPGSDAKGYTDHLRDLAGRSLNSLVELHTMHQERSLDPALARATAHVLRSRGRQDLFRQWAEGTKETNNALTWLERTPSKERFLDRCYKACLPPRAEAENLQPGAAEKAKYMEAKRAKAQPRREFFGGPRRQAGRRVS